MIKILIGGSPCTFWSIAQKQNRETEAQGLGWELFKNYLVAKEKFKPDVFLYENNVSAAKAIKEQIKEELKVNNEDSDARYIEINSALVSAQNRKRFYVHNCGDVGQPEDKKIVLGDILQNEVPEKYWYDRKIEYVGDKPVCAIIDIKGMDIVKRVYSPKYKAPTLTTSAGGHRQAKVYINGKARKLTPLEYERLQTMPDNYTAAVSDSQRYKGLGNGWTAEVIMHILNGALKDIPKDEEIVVLSMYDGIGTGRYCLDKMGFTNVTYFAYEIDKYAKQVAMSNYPDIKQMGDAFQVREPDWTIGY